MGILLSLHVVLSILELGKGVGRGAAMGGGSLMTRILAFPAWGLVVSPWLPHLGGGVQSGITPHRRLQLSRVLFSLHRASCQG